MVFIPNRGFLEDWQDTSSAKELLEGLAGKGASAARQLAPERSGDYVDGIEAEVGLDETGTLVGRVNAHDFKSHWIEFGTGAPGPTPAFAPLRRGVESAVGSVSRERR